MQIEYETKNAILGWSLSIVLHSLLILPFFVNYSNTDSVPGQTQISTGMSTHPLIFAESLPTLDTEINKEVTEPQLSADIDQANTDIQNKTIYPSDELVCADKSRVYLGVGILYSREDNTIIYAPEYYPAFKAGIRVGDRMLNPEATVDADEYITLQIVREGKSLIFRIKAEQICYTE